MNFERHKLRTNVRFVIPPHNLSDGYILMRPAGAGQLLRRLRQDPKSSPNLASA